MAAPSRIITLNLGMQTVTLAEFRASSRGAPLALYVRKGVGTQPPLFQPYGGIAGVVWSQGGLSYLLAGDEAEARLLKLADAIRTAKPEPAAAPADRSPPPPPPRPKPKP
jgi:hypothetical protein